jgi:hypothetical protein
LRDQDSHGKGRRVPRDPAALTTLVSLAVEAVQEGRGAALAAGVGEAQEAHGVAADVDRDLHRDLHVVAAENRDVAVTDDVADDRVVLRERRAAHDGDRGGGGGEHSGDTGLDLHVLLLSSMIVFPGRPGIHTHNVAEFNHFM